MENLLHDLDNGIKGIRAPSSERLIMPVSIRKIMYYLAGDTAQDFAENIIELGPRVAYLDTTGTKIRTYHVTSITVSDSMVSISTTDGILRRVPIVFRRERDVHRYLKTGQAPIYFKSDQRPRVMLITNGPNSVVYRDPQLQDPTRFTLYRAPIAQPGRLARRLYQQMKPT
jgi:hypothetical protein